MKLLTEVEGKKIFTLFLFIFHSTYCLPYNSYEHFSLFSSRLLDILSTLKGDFLS